MRRFLPQSIRGPSVQTANQRPSVHHTHNHSPVEPPVQIQWTAPLTLLSSQSSSSSSSLLFTGDQHDSFLSHLIYRFNLSLLKCEHTSISYIISQHERKLLEEEELDRVCGQ